MIDKSEQIDFARIAQDILLESSETLTLNKSVGIYDDYRYDRTGSEYSDTWARNEYILTYWKLTLNRNSNLEKVARLLSEAGFDINIGPRKLVPVLKKLGEMILIDPSTFMRTHNVPLVIPSGRYVRQGILHYLRFIPDIISKSVWREFYVNANKSDLKIDEASLIIDKCLHIAIVFANTCLKYVPLIKEVRPEHFEPRRTGAGGPAPAGGAGGPAPAGGAGGAWREPFAGGAKRRSRSRSSRQCKSKPRRRCQPKRRSTTRRSRR